MMSATAADKANRNWRGKVVDVLRAGGYRIYTNIHDGLSATNFKGHLGYVDCKFNIMRWAKPLNGPFLWWSLQVRLFEGTGSSKTP
jgi:hypothetical protein